MRISFFYHRHHHHVAWFNRRQESHQVELWENSEIFNLTRVIVVEVEHGTLLSQPGCNRESD